MSDCLVIIPTYNESQNVTLMIEKIFSLHSSFHILVVDDSSPDGTALLVKELQKKFSNNLFLLEREKKIEDHLNLYNKAHVALDTFPYPGVTTSYEAIVMGVPVLTMQGFNFNSRCGESINKNINMDELIASDDDDYVAKAKSLISDKKLNEKFGIKLRDKALKSPLFDTDKFVKDFENLIYEIY